MKIVFRLLILFILSLLGGLLYSFTVNLLIMADMIPSEELSGAFGYEMTNRAVLVWIASTVLALGSLFTDAKWRYALVVLPLFAPSFYAALYTISLG